MRSQSISLSKSIELLPITSQGGSSPNTSRRQFPAAGHFDPGHPARQAPRLDNPLFMEFTGPLSFMKFPRRLVLHVAEVRWLARCCLRRLAGHSLRRSRGSSQAQLELKGSENKHSPSSRADDGRLITSASSGDTWRKCDAKRF